MGMIDLPSQWLKSRVFLSAVKSRGWANKNTQAWRSRALLWKDAEPDIPILKEAKAEYTKLQ